MAMDKVTLEAVLRLAKQLTLLEKAQLIERVLPDLKPPPAALKSAYGICADLGPAPTAEEIDESRGCR